MFTLLLPDIIKTQSYPTYYISWNVILALTEATQNVDTFSCKYLDIIYSRRVCYVYLVLSFHFHFTSFILPPEKTYSGGALVSLACDFLQRKNARISRIPAQQQQSTITIVPTTSRYCHQAQFSKQKYRDVHPASVNLATDTRTIRNISRVASDIMKTIF